MSNRMIKINEKGSGNLIAEAIEDEGTRLFEGAWYFDRDKVNLEHLVITERTYICPYKGECYWIDLETPRYQAKDIGFTYFDVKPGYEFIQDKIGLYAGEREATVQTSVTIASI